MSSTSSHTSRLTKDRRLLLDRHGDAIARAGVDLDDLALLEFVFRADDEPREICRVLEFVDDDRSTFAPRAIMMLAIKSWVRGRSLGVPRMNIVMAAPTLVST